MSRLNSTIPALAIGVVTAALAAGCSAGTHTQTSTQVAAVSGANQTVEIRDGKDQLTGRVALRDLMVQFKEGGYPAGASAPLVIRLFNESPSPVRLCAVRSGTDQVVKATGSTPSASASASVSASAAPPAATPPAASGACPLDITIPTQGYTLLVPGAGSYLQIPKLSKAIEPGGNVPLEFVFLDSKGKHLAIGPFDVPIGVPLTPLPRASSVIGEGGGEHH